MSGKRKKSLILSGAGLLLGLCALWFLSVDRIEYVEVCPDCGSGRYADEVRVFSFPVSRIVQEHHTLLEMVAADLGVPCKHTRLARERLWKQQGLCIYVGEVKNGMFFIGADNSWYDEKMSARVRQMARDNPGLPEEFRKRALLDHDREYIKDFWKRIDMIRQKNASTS